MDFTRLENIIFTAVAGALALFLFIMAFYVISKGRRKTSGLDIFLRIIASLVLIVSAALFVLAIFTELTGSFRIAAAGDEAYFIIGDSVTKLPLGVIFVTLTTTTGQTIVIALFVIAFMTLVGDCLLAKKKFGKKTQKAKKSPEELKREAELAKIRKLSDSAVKKSNSAVNAADKTSTDASEKTKDEKEKIE
ncbi:MAG: hypothetical protein K2M48_07100, partial [Clostridiales bacterium]|nr:hypothetical protein [Clostridiales bacterium]